MALLVGCASERGEWSGPKAAAKVSSEAWTYNDAAGKTPKTQHYLIHTTIKDPEVLRRLPQVMEGAYQQYQQFVRAPMQGSSPMPCFVFSKRPEWAEFT